MKLFLDENITPKAKPIFEGLGYDVESIQSYHKCGIDDEEVLKIAVRESRILITQNGKDFVIQIPPSVQTKHFGLIWLKFHVTRANIENVCSKIHAFLIGEKSIADSIWGVEQLDFSLSFNKEYPLPSMVVSF